MNVTQPPLAHLLLRPVRAFLELGRPGQARSVDVGQVAGQLHHFRSLEPLVLDRVDQLGIDAVDRRALGGQQRNGHRGSDRELKGGPTEGRHQCNSSNVTRPNIARPRSASFAHPGEPEEGDPQVSFGPNRSGLKSRPTLL